MYKFWIHFELAYKIQHLSQLKPIDINPNDEYV